MKIKGWFRPRGTAEDVDEARWALQHLAAVTLQEAINMDQEAVELGLAGKARRKYTRDPSPVWQLANETTAETLSYISGWQEWRVRAQL